MGCDIRNRPVQNHLSAHQVDAKDRDARGQSGAGGVRAVKFGDSDKGVGADLRMVAHQSFHALNVPQRDSLVPNLGGKAHNWVGFGASG